jgi:ParB-like chromosome segregation protein Spo0J
MINWILEKRKLSALKPHKKNPRKLSKHDAMHLEKGMEKFGLIDKPIINADDTIIGGHQRISILKKQGVKEIDVYVPQRLLTEKEVDELNIRLNRNAGEFDYDILANQWSTDDLYTWGFTDIDIPDVDILDSIEETVDEPKKKQTVCPNCSHEF